MGDVGIGRRNGVGSMGEYGEGGWDEEWGGGRGRVEERREGRERGAWSIGGVGEGGRGK